MKKSLITFIFLYVCVTYSVNSQCTNIFPINGYTGIQTNNPQRPLNIHGDTLCSEVTERLSYGNVLFPYNLGHLDLLTPATINSYTLCLNRGLGDVVIESGLGQNNGGNVILSPKIPKRK